jgi:ribosomal protein L24
LKYSHEKQNLTKGVFMIKQGTRVKIINGEDAGKIGVVVAKAPGAGKAAEWNVAITGKGQVRVDEKDLEAVT